MKIITKPVLAAVAALLLPVGLSAQAPPPSPSPSPEPAAADPSVRFPAEVEQVTVDVVVTDKKGVPATGLTAADFQIFEEDKPQKIVSFDAVQVPETASAVTPTRPRISTNTSTEARTGRSFVVVFDDIHLTPFMALNAKRAVAEFLRTGVREGDRVSLVATGGGAWWTTRMEAGRDELIAMLKRLDGRHIPDNSPDRMSDYEAMRIHVYHDQQTEAVVARRFETFGATHRGTANEQSAQFGDGDPMVRGRASEIYFQSVSRNRITLQVLQRVLQSLAANKGRKSVILVSEGFIYDPNLDEFKTAIMASRRSNAAIYFLDSKGLQGGMPYTSAEFGPNIDNQDLGAAFLDQMQEAEGAESLAADSGGFVVKNTNDLARGISRIASESRSYYLIGYNPSDARRDGRFRKIQVKLAARKGLQVRARKGYYAPLDGNAKTAAKTPAIAGDPAVQAALDSPYDEKEIPLRMTSYVFNETLLGKASTLVATEIDLRPFAFEEQDGKFLDTVEFLLVVAHRETGEFFRYDQKVEMKLQPQTRQKMFRSWLPIVRDFELAPGGYQAKIVVRDKNSGRIGTVVHEFGVPDLSAFRVSTPVISDTLQASGDEKKATPRPEVTARRSFPAGSTLYVSFEVYGAGREKATSMPRVSNGYSIRRADGTVIATANATRITPTSLGKLSRIIGTPLGNAAPGEYELVLAFQDEVSGKSLEVREPFTVEAPGAAAGGAGSLPD
jgi:VWFA-related protein